MRRTQVLAVGIALVACAFVLGWLVADRSGHGAEPVTSSPYGSAQVNKAPAPERFFVPPMAKAPKPQSVAPKAAPRLPFGLPLVEAE